MATRITGLTALNARALAETLPDHEPVTLTKTTATFHMTPRMAHMVVAGAITRAEETRGRRGHPVQSLHAVLRKIARQL